MRNNTTLCTLASSFYKIEREKSNLPPKLVLKFILQPSTLIWFKFHPYTPKTVCNTPLSLLHMFMPVLLTHQAVFSCILTQHTRTCIGYWDLTCILLHACIQWTSTVALSLPVLTKNLQTQPMSLLLVASSGLGRGCGWASWAVGRWHPWPR
jgi:hypothetical protein